MNFHLEFILLALAQKDHQTYEWARVKELKSAIGFTQYGPAKLFLNYAPTAAADFFVVKQFTEESLAAPLALPKLSSQWRQLCANFAIN